MVVAAAAALGRKLRLGDENDDAEDRGLRKLRLHEDLGRRDLLDGLGAAALLLLEIPDDAVLDASGAALEHLDLGPLLLLLFALRHRLELPVELLVLVVLIY